MRRSQFSVTTYQGLTNENVNQQDTVSVRAAARAQFIGDGQVFFKCVKQVARQSPANVGKL